MHSHSSLGLGDKAPTRTQRPGFMEPLPGLRPQPANQVADGAPRAAKHRRSSGKTAQAHSVTAAISARALALTHTPPPPADPDDAAMRAQTQWIQHHLDFLTGTTGQGVALGGVTVGAGGATAGFLANLAHAGPFGPACAALALLSSCVDVYNAEVNAKDARHAYLGALVTLAENRRVLAHIGQRARDAAPRPEDASLKQITDTVIASLQAFAETYEKGFFRDPQSPHAQDLRRGLDQQAQAMVALKAGFDECGERLRHLQHRLDAPDLPTEERAGITNDIEALERRRARLLANAGALRKDMQRMHSHKRLQRAAKHRLAQARSDLHHAQAAAAQRAWSHGPDVENRLRAMRFARRNVLLKHLMALPPQMRKLPPDPEANAQRSIRLGTALDMDLNRVALKAQASAPSFGAGASTDRHAVLNTELLERWDADMLPPPTVQALEEAVAHIDAQELRSIEAEIAELEHCLRVQQADHQAIAHRQEQVQALEQDVQRLDRRLDKRLLAPFGDRGPAELDRLRDGTLAIYKNLLDAGATINTANIVWQVLPSLMSSLYLIMPVAALNVVTGVLDVRGGKRGMAAAAAAKGPLISRASHAAELFNAYSQDERLDVKSLQYALQAQLETAARQTRAFHHASQFNKARKAYGAQTIANGVMIVLTGIVTLVTGVPVVLGPAALGGTSGMTYAGRATQHVFRLRAHKHDLKQREAVAQAFVKRFGVEGIAELQRDMAEGFPGRWADRLSGFRRELLATKQGRGINPGLLQPHALAANTPLNIERLTRALVNRARDGRVGSHTAEADLVSSLALAQGQPDPGTWKLDGFASVQDCEKSVRAALKQLFGSAPAARGRRLLKNPRELTRVATRVNFWVERHVSHRHPLSEGGETLSSWIASVAQQPETFGARLAALSPSARRRLREQVAYLAKALREEGIGPSELLALQAVGVLPPGSGQEHPLKAFPLLMTPHAPYLFELIADPSWLTEPAPTEPAPAHTPAPPAPTPLATSTPDTLAGAELVTKLTTSFKSVGRSLRDGGAITRPRLPREADDTAPAKWRRQGLPRRAARAVQTRVKAVAKHVYQQTPNPMATPAKALEQLHKASDAERQELLQKILLSFAQEVAGPGIALEKDPAVMASLPAEPSATDVKRAHLRSWVQCAGQAAGTTADSLKTMGENRPKAAKDLKRMARRMEDTQVFCTALNQLLMDNTRPWEATLGLIEVA